MRRNRLPTKALRAQYRDLNPQVLDDIIAPVVKVAQPDTVILFGSAARGEMGPASDVDLLVIKSGRFDRRRLVGDIYMDMEGAAEAVDIIVVTPDEAEQYRDNPWLIIAPAMKEGKVVHGA